MSQMSMSLSSHRAINLFLRAYRDQWLSREEPGHAKLIEDITVRARKKISPVNKSLNP